MKAGWSWIWHLLMPYSVVSLPNSDRWIEHENFHNLSQTRPQMAVLSPRRSPSRPTTGVSSFRGSLVARTLLPGYGEVPSGVEKDYDVSVDKRGAAMTSPRRCLSVGAEEGRAAHLAEESCRRMSDRIFAVEDRRRGRGRFAPYRGCDDGALPEVRQVPTCRFRYSILSNC